MTKLQKWSTQYVAILLALAILMLLVPKVSAAEYTTSGATKFVFTDSGITAAEGNYTGYKIDGTELTINASGTYIVSGSCSDGSIKIKKGTTGVTLVLNGLTLTSAATAPIACNKSTEVSIVAAGTSYTLCSGSTSVAAATAQTGSSQSGGMGGGMQLGNNQQPGASQPQPGQTANPPQSPNAGTGTSSDSADTSADTGSAGSAASSASGNRFSDVSSGSWYYDAVQYVYNAGLMSGTGSSAFSPDGATTRGMIVAILYRLEGSPVCGSASFSDVSSGKYYAQAVAWAAENGIVSGYSSTRFAPEAAVTREQLAAILYRYAAYKGYDVSKLASLTGYADNNLVASYAKTPFAWAVQTGIISGTGANRLSPSTGATRAQVAAMLMHFCQSCEAA